MKIAIIGAGNMGGAIAQGLIQSEKFSTTEIMCANPTTRKLDELKAKYSKIQITTDNIKAAQSADVVMLAVKPWLIEKVIHQLALVLDYEKQLLVSIASGITFEQLTSFFEKENVVSPPLFRVIPNTAIEVRQSMTFITSNTSNKDASKLISDIFDELGETMVISESQMPTGTALASCGIAFVFRYIRAAMEAGVELGFYPDQSKEVLLQTLKGAVHLLNATGNHPEVEIDKVTTPGGITIKGLNQLEHAGFSSAIIQGLKACR